MQTTTTTTRTIKNRSAKPRTLTRDWDDESGLYEYYFLTPANTRRVKVVITEEGTASARCWIGRQVREGTLKGRFAFEETRPVDIDRKWTQTLAPGESVRVPAHFETYSDTAMRTGEFRYFRNRALAR
jgi:hypothetical protein